MHHYLKNMRMCIIFLLKLLCGKLLLLPSKMLTITSLALKQGLHQSY